MYLLKEHLKHKTETIMKKYVCVVCGWVYDPEVGDPEGGIAPGTAFEDIPDDWVCPCLLYTSPSPRDMRRSRMPSSA